MWLERLTAKQADGAWGDLVFVAPLLLVAVGSLTNVLTASGVRATAGPNGFTIRWGLLDWPSCTYRLDEIEHVEVIDLPWWRVSYGFWWTPSRTNCTVRSGPTVRLSLHNQRTITITVPDPACNRRGHGAASAAATSTFNPVSASATFHNVAIAASLPGRTNGLRTGGPLLAKSGP